MFCPTSGEVTKGELGPRVHDDDGLSGTTRSAYVRHMVKLGGGRVID